MVLSFIQGLVREQPVQAINELATHMAQGFNRQYGG